MKLRHQAPLTPWVTPYDVHCVERERFPIPVSRSRWADRLTFGLCWALFGACCAFACVGIIATLCQP